jgi:hypothetical protein
MGKNIKKWKNGKMEKNIKKPHKKSDENANWDHLVLI